MVVCKLCLPIVCTGIVTKLPISERERQKEIDWKREREKERNIDRESEGEIPGGGGRESLGYREKE